MINRYKELSDEMLKTFYEKAYMHGYEDAQLKQPMTGGAYTYRQGYENGRRDQKLEENLWGQEDIDYAVDVAEHKGQNEAWHCASETLLNMSSMQMRNCFKVDRWQDIFNLFSGEEAVKKFKEWENNNE